MTPLQRGIDHILALTLLSLSQLMLGEGRLKIGAFPIFNQGEEEAEWANLISDREKAFYSKVINYLRYARAGPCEASRLGFGS